MKNSINWLSRVLLVPRLRMKMKVRSFRRGFATLCTVDCSTEETDQVRRIGYDEIMLLVKGMQRQLNVSRSPGRIQVLCFGRSARLEKIPRPLNRWGGWTSARGVWLRDFGCALARFDPEKTIRQIVIHEMAHALLDLLTDSFPYPLAINEGVARHAEYLLPDSCRQVEWKKEVQRRGTDDCRSLRDSECMSIKELLFFGRTGNGDATDRLLGKMTNLSFWLNMYLWGLSETCPQLKGMLGTLREERLVTPGAVYQWLQNATELGEEELEASFHRYCTTGDVGPLR